MASSTPELDKIKNVQHRRLVLEFAANGFKNKTQAGIAAGYKERTANRTVSKVFQRPEVNAAVEEQKTLVLAKVESELDMEATAIMREMAIVGGSSVADYLSFNEDGIKIKDSDDINPHKLRAIKSVKMKKTKDGHEIDLVLHDKMKGLEGLAKAKGMYSDVDTSVKVELVITGRE
jgi:hypothetical protein